MGFNIMDFAYELIALNREVEDLRLENAELLDVKEKYNRLLDDSLNHGQAMAGNMLKVLLTPGVTESLKADPSLLIGDKAQ